DNPIWNKDGTRLAYTARPAKGNKASIVVVDGQESKPYTRISQNSLTFSRDGKRFAYTADETGKPFWVIDGKVEKMYTHVSVLEFSRDGTRYAYAGDIDGKF